MANIIEDIKENIEEGLEKIEEIAEKVVKDNLPEAKESIEEIAEDIEEAVEESGEEVEEVVEELQGKELEEAAEKESTEEKPKEIDPKEEKKIIEAKKKALLKKVKELSKKVETTTTEDLKEQVKIKKKTDTLIPLEEYVKSGIYLGTRVVTPDMKQYIYRRRADGLAIFNTDIIDEKLKEAGEYLAKFKAEDVILVCKRQAGWKAAKMFSELTGIRVFTKKYPAGILTNTQLEDFFETELAIVTDSWLDKNALKDTLNVKKKVLMICDTNNFSKGADQIIIGNNKSPKSLGVIFYLLTRQYCKAKELECNIPDLEYWTGELEETRRGAKFGV